MTGHFGIYRSADGRSLRAQVPMYNKPVYNASISARHRWRRGHRLERHMIWRLDPRVAAVETDSGGPAAPWRPTNLHRFAPYYTQLARKVTNKLTYKYLGRPMLTPVEKGSWWCPPDARRAVVLDVLGSARDLRCAPLFDDRRLRELIRAAKDDGDFTATTLLGRILAVELALRHADAAVDG
jgi:hypothetical protein